MFWYGSDALWTVLPVSGKGGVGGPGKSFWWRKGYDPHTETNPHLILTARRIDGEAPSIAVSDATNAGGGMLIGFRFRAAGCWEVTGHYDGNAVSFVVLVEP